MSNLRDRKGAVPNSGVAKLIKHNPTKDVKATPKKGTK